MDKIRNGAVAVPFGMATVLKSKQEVDEWKSTREFLMAESLGTQYLERKKVIETEIKRLQDENKRGSDVQADLQRQHSDIGRQLDGIKAEFLKQSGKLETVNELIEGLKQEVTPVIPLNAKKK